MSVISMILIITIMKGGIEGTLTVDVNSKDPILKIGQNFTCMCTVTTKISHCLILLPGKCNVSIFNEIGTIKPDYLHVDLNSGQCGITISQIKDKHNGLFQCSMGIPNADKIVGSTNVTVAMPPHGPPELLISPKPDKHKAYKENTTIAASCSVREARPKANLTWYFGDEKITSGVNEEIIEFPGNLYTVNQNFIRTLTWRDNAKILRCEANHITYDHPLSINQSIEVLFAPRPKDTIEKFSLMIGENETIAVQIEANPSPIVIIWQIDNETIHAGKQDSARRVTASHAINVGNNTWNASLSISAVTSNDIKRNYSMRALNPFGEQQYRVIITEAAPEVIGIDGGPCPAISEECLTCLCEVSTDCDFNKLCNNFYCGPFSISHGFWQDGGMHISNKSILHGEESWQSCANDPLCAAMTVRDYMKKYCTDCNEDGTVNCVDFALLHQLGPSCHSKASKEFKQFQKKLENCLKEIME